MKLRRGKDDVTALQRRLQRLDDRTLINAASDSLNGIGKALGGFSYEEQALDEALYGARQLVAICEVLQARRSPLP